jgi:hypothetical protein
LKFYFQINLNMLKRLILVCILIICLYLDGSDSIHILSPFNFNIFPSQRSNSYFKGKLGHAPSFPKELLEYSSIKQLQSNSCSSVSFMQKVSYAIRSEYSDSFNQEPDYITDYQLSFHLNLSADLEKIFSQNSSQTYPIFQTSEVFGIRYYSHHSLPNETSMNICYAPPQTYLKDENSSQLYSLKDLESRLSPLNWSSIIDNVQLCFDKYSIDHISSPSNGKTI